MENNNQVASSFTDDLFGAADTSPNSASNGFFSSIFAPPSPAAAARNYTNSKFNEEERKVAHGSRSLDNGVQGDVIKDKEGMSNISSGKETNSIFQERSEPSPLTSSLYYGGREDMYVQSSSPHTSGPHSDNKKDGGADDLNGNNLTGVSRGNWWEGSLYY